jgi:hypothetical protein
LQAPLQRASRVVVATSMVKLFAVAEEFGGLL